MSVQVDGVTPGAGSPELRRVEDRTDLATKSGLYRVSRSIEDLATRTARRGAPLVLVAMFEEASYFAYERERYERLAASGTVVVGFRGTDGAATPVPTVDLAPHPDLADEWSVFLVSPLATAGLLATDMSHALRGSTLELGRAFRPRMSTSPRWVADQVDRVLDAVGHQLPDELVGRVGPILDDARRLEPDHERSVLSEALESTWWRGLVDRGHLHDLERQALTDSLTGAHNRRFLQRYLHRVGPRAPSLAAAAFDFDDFKGVNDRYGHATGDALLRAFVDVVRAHTREHEVLVRLGGDEFLLLLPDTDLAVARQRVGRVLDAFAEVRLPPPADHAEPRASAGVGVFPAHALDLEAVDAALYAAKRRAGGIEVVG